MPSSFSPAPDEVAAIGDELIAEYHPELAESGVTITYLMAESNGPGPAIRHGGYPADAIVKVNNLKDRVEGKADATITLDGDAWPEWSDAERRALVDHELHHLTVKRHASGDEEGQVKTDSAGRPELSCKRHDLVLGGFEEVARRHGASAPEMRAARALKDKYGDLILGWGDLASPAGPGGGSVGGRSDGRTIHGLDGGAD